MIPFSPPRIDQRILDEVIDTLKSGWITTGPKTKRLEKMITQYAGHQATLCVSSASAGLELMLRWYGIGPDDEVIVPVYTYTATANVVIHCGAKVIFVDVADDFNIDIQQVKKAITSKTKVIMPVDLAGFPCDYNSLNTLVDSPEIKALFSPDNPIQKQLGRILILADAAHSIGATYHGKKSGALTDITVYSFHAVKNLTTAEGGAICLNLPSPFDNEIIQAELNTKSLHGQNKDALAKFKIGNWRYDIVEAGYKCNMTDIQAAMGLVELERYEQDMLPRRKAIFHRYAEKLEKYDWAQLPPFETADKTSSYHVFALRIHNITEIQRDEIIQHIFAMDVAVNVHFIPLAMMSFYKDQGYDIRHYPIAYNNFSREISLPVYYDLTDEMVDQVVSAVITSVEKTINRS